jgi:hypothetical protein
MENCLKRKLADGVLTFCMGVSHVYLTADNDVGYRLSAARADIERMPTIPVPRI